MDYRGKEEIRGKLFKKIEPTHRRKEVKLGCPVRKWGLEEECGHK